MSNSGDNSRSSTPSDSLHDGPGHIQSTSIQRPRKKYPKKRRLHPDRARVMSLLPEYDARGITNRDEISKRLRVEHQIDMSAPTIARLRRDLCLVKRPMPTQGLSWKEKEIRVMNNMFRNKYKPKYPQEDPKTKKRMWKVYYLEEGNSNYNKCDYWDMDKPFKLSSRDEDSEEGNDNEKIKFKRGRKLAMIRPARIIQDRLKEGKDGKDKIHIPLEEISKVLKQVKECKTGPNSEWRIEIYQPIPELEVWLMGIRDVWSEGRLTTKIIERLQDEILCELLSCLEPRIKSNRITIKLPDEEPRDFEPANIIRDFLFSNDISVEETLQKLSTAPAYPIIKGELPKGSRAKLSEMLERWRDGITNLTEANNLNPTDFRHRSLITGCWNILLDKESDDLWESESRYKKCTTVLGLSDDSYDTLDYLQWFTADNFYDKLNVLINRLTTPLVCKEIRRFHEVWGYLYSEPKPFTWAGWERPLEDFINLSNVWNIVEKMLPLWEKQFEHDEHGEWTLTKEFIDPRRETSSSLPYSNTPPMSEVTDASAGLMLMELSRGYSTVPEQESLFYPKYGHNFMPNTSGPLDQHQPQMQMMPSYHPEGGHVNYANPGPAYSAVSGMI